MKLSILIPVYNERSWIEECLRRVIAAPLPAGIEKEILVVDDGSTDGSGELIQGLAKEHPQLIIPLSHPKNSGKGAALKTAAAAATGEIILIQDGDLEYDPSDYPALIEPILSERADAVFGSRFSKNRDGALNPLHSQGNRALTAISNALTGLRLTDMWAGYKAFKASVLKSLPLQCSGFSVEAELIAKLAQNGLRIEEVPVSYASRNYSEGKKLGPTDAVAALAAILFFGLRKDSGRA